MDDAELSARLDRLDRYFELMQEQHLQVRADIAALDRKTDGLQQQLNVQQTQLDGLQAQLFEVRDDLRTEMRERFESVDEQIRTLTRRVERTDDNVIRVQQDLEILKSGVAQVDKSIVELHGRVDALKDDMRQRFRGVNERLSNIEKRNVA